MSGREPPDARSEARPVDASRFDGALADVHARSRAAVLRAALVELAMLWSVPLAVVVAWPGLLPRAVGLFALTGWAVAALAAVAVSVSGRRGAGDERDDAGK